MRRYKLFVASVAVAIFSSTLALAQVVQIGPPVAVPSNSSPVYYSTTGGRVLIPANHQHSSAVVVQGACSNGSCSSGSCSTCDTGCYSCRLSCDIQWLKPWKCSDLEMKPVERKCKTCHTCCGGLLHSLLWCPKDEEEKKDEEKKDEEKKDEKNGNGKDEKKNGNGNGKNGDAEKNGNGKNGDAEKKNGNGDKKDEAKKDDEKKEDEAKEEDKPTPLMGLIECYNPCLYKRMTDNGVKFYGFVQGGFTANFDSPRDRLNYGTNFNNRSNDVLLNQLYFILEKPLDLDKKVDCFHLGYRVDLMFGHDAPYFENAGLGLLQDFLGDRLEASRLTENGLGMWNAFVDVHMPILTKRGVDLRLGRFISLMGHDASLGNATLFYSRPYEFFYGVPFTNFGALATIHIADTVDFQHGIVRGYEVVTQDNNDTWSYTGAWIWNSCDKTQNVTLSWILGPEALGNNRDERNLFTVYFSKIFGCYNEWKYVGGGSVGWEQNAAIDLANGNRRSGEWYGLHSSLFYTIDPRLTFGVRGEWWHDDDGVRTGFANSDNGGALWNRPGYAGSFYGLTFGANYKPFQNVMVRPELRFDWFRGIDATGGISRPFNDQRDNFQVTAGFDIIWQF